MMLDHKNQLQDAPADLCCQLDGRLLTDPVRTPSGHAFERSALAEAISQHVHCKSQQFIVTWEIFGDFQSNSFDFLALHCKLLNIELNI